MHNKTIHFVKQDIDIELTDPQTTTIRGHSDRSSIQPMGLVERTVSRSPTTNNSKVSSLYETIEDELATHAR